MADEKKAPRPDPIARHHRQAAWQIWVPLGLGIALFVALCVICAIFVISPPYRSSLTDTLAPVATIWLVIPNCITSLIPIAILFGLVFGTSKMLGGLPKLGSRIHLMLDKLGQSIQSLSSRVAGPIIKVGGLKAGWDRFWEMVSPAKPQDKGG
jgi:hypothetical protein